MKKSKKLLSVIICLALVVSSIMCVGNFSASAATQDIATNVDLEKVKTTANMKRGSYIFDTTTYENGVLKVVVPAEQHKQLLTGSQSINAYLTAIPDSSAPRKEYSGSTRAILVKYKVKSIGEGGYAQVGIGHGKGANGWTATYIVGVDKMIYEADDDKEYTFAASIPYSGATDDYRLVFGGYQGVEYEITSIKWGTKSSLKYAVVRYHIGEDFMHPVFCNNQAQKTSGFASLGAEKDTVSKWYNADGEVVTGNVCNFGSNLTKSGDIDLYDKVVPQGVIANYDFEDESDYVIDSPYCDPNQWIYGEEEIDEGEVNHFLTRKAENGASKAWGLVFPNTKIIPGRVYKLSFRVKSSIDATLDYSLLAAENYWKGNFNHDGDVFANDHRYQALKANEWTEVTEYFVGKSYAGGSLAHFNIMTAIFGGAVLSFDDFIIEGVEGVSINEYGNKYSAPIVYEEQNTISLPGTPDRDGYIFGGYFYDSKCTMAVNEEDEYEGAVKTYAKWTKAPSTLTDVAAITESGVTPLNFQVASATAYPVAFDLATNCKVKVSIFTASKDAPTVAKSVAWEREFTRGGTVSCIVETKVLTADGVKGDYLYIATEYTAEDADVEISNFNITETTVTAPEVKGDFNNDGVLDVLDFISLKLAAESSTQAAKSAITDLNDDGLAADTDDCDSLIDSLLGNDGIPTTKFDRNLVWSEEFDGNAVNTDKFSYINYDDKNNSRTSENVNVSGGNLNLNVTKFDGADFLNPKKLTTADKMQFNGGYIEIRAKMSLTPNQWASFWLASKDGGEIDIFETMNSKLQANIHGVNGQQYLANMPSSCNLADINASEYHTFGMLWDAEDITFYIDGVAYATANIAAIEASNENYEGIFDNFYSVILSETYHSGLSYDDPMPKYSIDYVRLYQNDSESLMINGVAQ